MRGQRQARPRRGTKLDPGRRLPYFSPVSASRELKRRNFAPPCQEAASRPWLATRDQAGPLPLRTPTAGSRSRTQPRPQSRARPRRSGTRSFGRNRERWPRPLVAPHGSTSDAWTLILMRMMLVIPAMRAMQLTAAPAARMHLRDVPGSDTAHNSGRKRGDRGCLRSARNGCEHQARDRNCKYHPKHSVLPGRRP